jgi:hypothetical protein
MRAAEIVAVNGYPLDGYALLRNAKEQALCIGAIASGHSSFPAWYGYKGMDPSIPVDHEKNRLAARNRKVEEFRIRSITLGRNSGLGEEHIRELERWENLFNMQVHGSRFSMAQDYFRMQKGLFSIGPLPDEDVAMYMNRFSEISWMAHRILWYLQRADVRFDGEWERRWNIMDESIRFMVLGLDELGKKIAKTFEAMIDAKFQFGPGTCYVERD